jgi:hypothetical protein
MKFLIFPMTLSVIACTTTEKIRQPSSTELWNLEQVTLSTDKISGDCILSPSSLIRRSNMSSQTSFTAGLKVENCNLTSKMNLDAHVAVVFSGNYSSKFPTKMTLTIKLGDLEYANSETQDQSLTAQGYQDIDLTGAGVYKLNPAATLELNASCGVPYLNGVFGFRKVTTKCILNDNAGTVILTQE